MASIKEKDKIQKEKKRNIEILRSYTVDLSDEDEDEDEEVVVQEVRSKRNVSKKKKFVGASNVRGPLDLIYQTNHGKKKQSTLDKNNPIKENLKMNAWDKIATWAYSVGLPFNVVRDEGFQDMINSISEYGRGMPAPSYHNICVTLMKKHSEDTQKFVDSFRPHWEEYRCSIMSDFWTDGKGRCFINFLVNCPFGTVFLKSIDASEHVKNAQLIVEMINEVIKDVGEETVVQFITDNESNFKATGKILEEQHSKLFWTPCAAHCVNRMIGDIGEKIPKIKNTLADARAIVVYIYNHGRILNLMRKLTKNKELHKSCVTRFATQFYTIQSIHENRHHIQVLFVSEEWKKSDFAKKLVDTEEKPCMGYIYDAVNRAKEQIKKNLSGTPNERMITRLWAMIQARWSDQLHHPLHAVGCYLNPAIFYGENSREIRKNNDIATGLYVAIDRLVPDNDDNDKLRQDLNLYIDLVGQFGSPAAIRAKTKVAPFLSQTCSASPCECNWSAFDNLHSKKRNCLLQQKLNDLVFIQYNTRLQRRYNSLKSNRSLDPILLRDVEENDDWVIPTEVELQEFVDGGMVFFGQLRKRQWEEMKKLG
ncbi:unnamed protein product [Lactuca saligna]|uniref:DUF659 domain-containing protein n=1 Tax=Lactuca saligna TaxID=75948 RepID=A0AA36EH83_LACSI|nr:unnamed protein product [Lactuca saligna]